MTAPTTDALLWDATFPLLRLQGGGARDFLHGQTSADLQQAAHHALIRSCWLTATGRVQALLEVRLDDEGADVLVLSGDAAALASGFDRVIFPADRVRLLPLAQQRRLQRLQAPGVDRPWCDDVLWCDDSCDNSAIPAAWEALPRAEASALEAWRLRVGLPGHPAELNGDTNPLELGLGDWLSLSKGCYLGQETIAKLTARDGVKQKLRHWQLVDAPIGLTIEPGTPLRLNNERAGVITSALHTPGGWQGLALVRRAALEAPQLQLGGEGGTLQISPPTGFRDLAESP
jgi:tRNA-modifying protein YgfZ